MRNFAVFCAAAAIVGVLVAFSGMRIVGASAAGPERGLNEPAVAPVGPAQSGLGEPDAAQRVTGTVSSGNDEESAPAALIHDPTRFGKLDYEPLMDAASQSRRANSGGDIPCPGTEPCGP
jgi:hypothetical protein